jgi:hypothetical protein
MQILGHLPPLGDVFTGDLSFALLMRLGLRRTLAFEGMEIMAGGDCYIYIITSYIGLII